jgi:hypothetical protein
VSAARPRRRPAPAPEGGKRPRLAIEDPATQAWLARMLQVALERRRRRLAAAKEGGGHDGTG